MHNSYCVYMHENKSNGKRYFGITKVNPKKRWQNGKGYIYNKHFYNAIELYGWNGFKHIIIATKLTKEEAEQKEIDLIKEYQTQDINFGYNVSMGGGKLDKVQKEKMYVKRGKTKSVCISLDRNHRKFVFYKDCDEASEATGLSKTFIKQCCEHLIPQPRGFYIEYLPDIR